MNPHPFLVSGGDLGGNPVVGVFPRSGASAWTHEVDVRQTDRGRKAACCRAVVRSLPGSSRGRRGHGPRAYKYRWGQPAQVGSWVQGGISESSCASRNGASPHQAGLTSGYGFFPTSLTGPPRTSATINNRRGIGSTMHFHRNASLDIVLNYAGRSGASCLSVGR